MEELQRQGLTIEAIVGEVNGLIGFHEDRFARRALEAEFIG
jgi:hypothetical protein